MGFQVPSHCLDLFPVSIDARIETTEHATAQRGNQVNRQRAPTGGHLVEDPASLHNVGAVDLVQAGAKPCRRQHLWLHQSRRLVLRAQQPVLDAFHRQNGPSDNESCKFSRVFADGDISPLIAQLEDLRGLARHDGGPRWVLGKDAALQEFGGSIRAVAGQQRHHTRAHRQPAGHPEHPHRHHRTVFVLLEFLHQLGHHGGRWTVVGRQFEHVDVEVGMLAPLAS